MADYLESIIAGLFKRWVDMGTGEHAEAVVARLPGSLKTLLAQTTITADGTVNHTPVTGLDIHTMATILLTVSGKAMDADTTLDIYLQYSPDGGTTWDDLAAFAQITNVAIGNGTYVLFLNANAAASAVDRATAVATLAANSVKALSWCDRIRVATKAAGFAGADTVAVKLQGYFQ